MFLSNMTTSGMILFFILFAIFLGIVIANIRKPYSGSTKHKLTFEPEDLFKALGGQDNVEAMKSNHSKLHVKLKDMKNFDPEALKKLGATGIVAKSYEIIIIFGKASKQISDKANTKIQQ